MKLINSPKRAAGEYSKYAMSFYEGCTEDKCSYCYMKAMSRRFGTYFEKARLKAWLIDEKNAFEVFKKEVKKLLPQLQKHGLFFNFSSDPYLPQSIDLNVKAFYFCELYDIPVYTLTKQAGWIDRFISQGINSVGLPKNVAVGFTLTGKDELEPGCSPNAERIVAMKRLYDLGFKTWASIEPVIDVDSSLKMIEQCRDFCHLFKIGMESGKKYENWDYTKLVLSANIIINAGSSGAKVYYKESVLKKMPNANEGSWAVGRDYNLFEKSEKEQ